MQKNSFLHKIALFSVYFFINILSAKTYPECCICSNQIKSNYLYDNQRNIYCSEKCFQKTLPQCFYCKKHVNAWLSGRHDTVKFCQDCMNRYRKCDLCSLPLGTSPLKLKDGRIYCSLCINQNVNSVVKAEQIFLQVRKELKNKLGISTEHKINFHLISQQEMQKLSPKQDNKELGLYTNKTQIQKNLNSGETTITEEQHDIYILYGLPLEKFCLVAAHELGHDWMIEHVGSSNNLMIIEGWAELLAYRYAQNKSGRYKLAAWDIENNQDPVYGNGFRLVRQKLNNIKNPNQIKLILRNLL